LGTHLAISHLLPKNTLKDFSIEQGFEMGRPSKLYVQIQGDSDMPESVRVGGYSVTVSSGEIRIP
jgi:predicted PhzF superfamily epimerase YddE/YHI9